MAWTYRMVYDDDLRRILNTIHTLEPARPSFLIHPSKHDLPRPMCWHMMSSTAPTPLTGEPADRLDDLIPLYAGRSNRDQDNQWPPLRIHHVLERFLAQLHG